MNRHLKKYSKDKMFSKIIYFIIEEMKYYKSKYYDLFAELNECEPVLTRRKYRQILL